MSDENTTSGGDAAPAPAPAPARGTTLGSGRKADLAREPTGADLEMAFDVAGKRATNPVSLSCALFAMVGTIDGARVVYEDIRAMPATDVMGIVTLVQGGGEGAVPLS